MTAPSLPSGAPDEALLALLRDKFDLALEEVALGDHRFWMAVVRQPEKLLDAISADEFARDERVPYWAELWTSSIALGEHLLRDSTLRGAAVLELGCGVGLAGIAAVRAGAEVTMTDYDDDALLFARWNAGANLDGAEGGRLKIRPRDWRLAPPATYDVIVGADIVYERRHFQPLMTFFEAALRPDGYVLLGEPCRSMGDDFFAGAVEKGFDVTEKQLSVDRRGRTSSVRLCTLRKGSRA